MSKKMLSQLITVVLCFLMFLPGNVFAGQAVNDCTGHWAESQIKSFVEKGIASPYEDGSFRPNKAITRAEFAAMVNKAFEFREKDDSNFKDVGANDSFYADMAIAKKAGYLTGLLDGTVKPNSYMSRQEYAVIIARLLKLDAKLYLDEIKKFKDAESLAAWSKGSIGAAVKYGYMNGVPGDIFDPVGSVTRGQAVAVLERCYLDNVKIIYNKPGKYSAKVVEGSVSINAADVTLEDTTINGNLIISEGVGNGNVKLKGVVVKGKTIVRGGGINSIIIEDSQITSIIIIKEDNKVRIVAVGRTSIGQTDMQSGGRLEEQGTGGSGFGYVTIAEGIDPNEQIILRGNFESVQVLAGGINLNVESGSIASINVAPTATNSQISLSAGTRVNLLVAGAPISVTGTGTINTADVQVQGTVIAAPTTTINTAAGITVGTTMPAPTPAPAPTPSGSTPGSNGSTHDNDNGPIIIRVNAIIVTGAGSADTLVNGGTLQMGALITPSNATNKNITWSVVPGTGTAMISSTGLVTATGVGTVTVRAAAQDASGVVGTKVITIVTSADTIEIYARASGGEMLTSEVKLKVNGSFINSYTLYFDGNPLAPTTNGSIVIATEVLHDMTRVQLQHNGVLKSDTDGTVTNVISW